MRIFYLGNNLTGLRILDWLKSQNEEVVGLVLHPSTRQKYGLEIAEASGLPTANIFLANQLDDEKTLNTIRGLDAEIGLSIFYGYILKTKFFEIFPGGCLNLHPALLPYNRGSYPNVWSIIENTPAGVTLHYVDEGIDSGDIVAQKEVPVFATDTGRSLYKRLEEACLNLFIESWALIRKREIPRLTQKFTEGTYHTIRDVEEIDYIDLEEAYTARELIDIIRARTFPPYRGAYILNNGQRIYLRLQLLDELSLEEESQEVRNPYEN